MNNKLYRVIFNKARGLLMVVAENGRGHGKGPASGEGHTLSQLIGKLSPVAWVTLSALGMVALLPAASAAGIVADGRAPGNQQPTVVQSANGTPQVNIQTPSAAGVSRNTYSQFDVDKKGAILNNSHRNVQTQQGGWVAANPWLAKGEAKIILNEVNSRDPSKLNGYIEVAGQKAQVVIANPAGIGCDGCGFINASRSTLTTGKPVFDGQQLRGYQVDGGEIVVQGAGMDSSRQDYTDLIARTVKVNSGVWANDLKVTTGRNRVDAESGSATKTSATADSAADDAARPVVSLDVAQLGGMYAGKIRLVGTENGVGVRNAGSIGAQAGSVTISADGHIENSGAIGASQDVQLNGKSLANSGTLYGQRDVEAKVSGSLSNSGTVAAQRNARASARQISGSSGSVFAAGVNSDGSLGKSGDLSLTASGLLTSSGQHLAPGKLSVQAAAVDLSGSQSAGSDVSVQATNGTLASRNAVLQSSGRMELSARGGVDNRGGKLVSGGALALTSDKPDSVSTTASRNSAPVAASANASGASVQASAAAQVSDNAAQASAAADLKGTAAQASAAADVKGTATQATTATAQNAAAEPAAVTAGLNNDGGLISATGGDLSVSSTTLTNRSGRLESAGDVTVNSGSLNNAGGIIVGQQLTLNGGDNTLNNQAGIAVAAKGLTLNAASLANQGGTLMATGSLNLNAAGVDNRSGTLLSQQDFTLNTAQLNNQQGRVAGSNLTVNSAVLNNQQGQISADNALHLQNGGSGMAIANDGGTLIAGKSLTADAQSLSGSGDILSLGDLRLGVRGDFASGGSTIANGNLDLNVQGTLDNGGKVAAGQQLNLSSAALNNRQSGEISGLRTLVNVAGALTNRGLIDGVETVLRAASVSNIGSGRLYGDQLSIQAAELNNLAEGGSSATIAARQRLDLGVGTLNNSEHSLIYSDGDMSIGGWLDENFAAGGRAGVINNHSATIESAGNMLINTTRLNNINDRFSTRLVHVSDQQKNEYMVVALNNGVHYDDADYDITFYKDEVQHICIAGVVCNQDHYYQYSYTQSIWQDQIVESDPGQILAGGSLAINAEQTLNDKSRIIAGGDLLLASAGLQNADVPGQQIISQVGQVIEWDRIHKKGKDSQKASASPYTPPDVIQQITLKPNVVQGNTQVNLSGPVADGFTASQAGAVPVNSGDLSSLPGGQRIEIAGKDNLVVRSQIPDASVPEGSLFSTRPATDSGYLIETDPRFTNQKTWLSSDYMLAQLASDPGATQKRLGDGFYEQRLVREQIVELTGDRYLAGYDSDEEQYKALMESGVAFAKQFGLTPGVALTADQMAQVTSDMVWLVSREVTLADGSRQQVLAPQVYAQVQQGDIDGSGALLAGRNVAIGVSGGMLNQGKINASQLLDISGDTITNVGGIISGGKVQLLAGNDLVNNGGLIQAQTALTASAGRDITLASPTTHAESTNGSNSFSRDSVSRAAGMYVQQEDGTLALQAGRDVTLQGATLNNSGSQTTVLAGRDITLASVGTARSDTLVWDKDNHVSQASSTRVVSDVTGNGDVAMQAGRNLTSEGATVNAASALTLTAGNDLLIDSARNSASLDMASKVKGSGFLSKNTTTTRAGYDEQTAAGSSLGGATLTAGAGHDLTVRGSDVAADDALTLRAGNDLNVTTAEQERDAWSMTQKTKSGLMSSGGIGFTLGSTLNKVTEESTGTTARGSTVGAVNGDATLTAGNDLRVQGSQLIAGNDISLVGKNVTIESAENSASKRGTSEQRSSGLTLALSGAVGTALNTAKTISELETNKQDKRVAQLQQVKAGLDGYQAVQGVRSALQDPMNQSFVGIELKLGASQSHSESQSDAITSAASAIQAAHDLNIFATGSDGTVADGDISVQGSQLQAGNAMLLSAARDISLRSSQDSQLSSSKNSSSSGEVGVGIGVGSDGWGISVSLSGSKGSGKEHGDGVTHNETTLDAGNQVTLLSGRDTTLTGAQVSADRVVADVGRDLTLTSEQDSNNVDSKQKNVSGGLKFTFGSMTVSGNLSVNNSKLDSNYQSVQEQSGIFAGDGGYDVTVGNHTQLNGAVIGSTAAAENNRLDTGTLGFSDLINQADFSTSSVGVGLSSSFGLPKDNKNDGAAPKDQIAETKPVTPILTQLGQNVAPDAMSASQRSGDGSSTTYSAVSDGTLIVRNAGQQQQDVSTLSRDVEHANQTLSPIFDKAAEQKRLQKVQLIGSVASSAVNTVLTEHELYAQRQGIAELGEDAPGWGATHEAHKAYWDAVQATSAYKKSMDGYEADGTYKMAANAAVTAIGGLAEGDPAKALAQASAPYLAGKIKDLTYNDPKNPTAQEIATNAFAHAILGGVVAQMSGQNATAGAIGAGGSELAIRAIHQALYPDVKVADLSGQQEKTIKNLALIAASLSGALVSDDTAGAVDAYNTGKNAVENNYLRADQLDKFAAKAQGCKQRGDCDAVRKEMQTLSLKQQDQLVAVCATDPTACKANFGDVAANGMLVREAIDRVLGNDDVPWQMKSDMSALYAQQIEAEGVVSSTEFARQLQSRYGIDEQRAQLLAGAALSAMSGGIKLGGRSPAAVSSGGKGASTATGSGKGTTTGSGATGSSGSGTAGNGGGSNGSSTGGTPATPATSEAALPLGGKNNQMNQPKNPSYQPVRNQTSTVGNREYSGHALDRMQDRGIMPSVVENTIKTGAATSSRGNTTVYYDATNNVSVVTNSSGKVVTVKYGK